MLQTLTVRNMALIEEAHVAFGEGLNILSGETGAGKSILLGAIQTALGGRVPKDIIGSHGDSAYVELQFSVPEDLRAPLREACLLEDGQDELTVSRRISPGRSVCRIGGEMVTASAAAAAGDLLLDIYGQREHQVLLKRQTHLEILDAYCGAPVLALRQSVAGHVKDRARLRKELDSLESDEAVRRREISFLTFVTEEIDAAALVPGEDTQLAARYKKLTGQRQLQEGIGALRAMFSSDEAGSVGSVISDAMHTFSRIEAYDEEGLAAIRAQLYDLESLASDLSVSLADYEDGLESDGEALAEVEARLDVLHDLKAKYGDSIPDILAYAEEQRQKLADLLSYDERKASLEKELAEAEAVLARECRQLTDARRKGAERLEKDIVKALTELNFAQVKFRAAFTETEDYTPLGRDKVEFLISVNPGEPLKPLVQVASGGELSRIMLAVKTVLADTDRIPTLIFDEIDAGISGRTAQLVAEKLTAIADGHQVICISHLPQIVSMADTHFLIEKTSDDTSTGTAIRPLTTEGSIGELSRLIGGAAITEATRAQAAGMKEQADMRKREIRTR